MTMRQQSPRRQSIERLSLRPAAYLHHLPRWLPPVAVAILFVAGIAIHGWAGAAMLLVVACFAGWLAVLSWPALRPQRRALRVAVLAALLALALWQGLR